MNNKSIMLKEHLKKHFKSFKTIKLKRHHYILGGFGIAAITMLASIIGFQNIGTHAKDASTIDGKFIDANSQVSITETDFCDVLNTTGVNKNETGEINIYCKLGECRETEVPKAILSGYNEKINITSDVSNTTCLVACQQGVEANDNCHEFDEDGKLKYDNVFTFTFEGISAGTSDIKLLENKITNSSGNGNTEVSGDMITVNEENEIIQVGCDFTGDTIKVNEGAGGEISLKCNISNLPEFDNIRDAMKITTISGSDVIATGTSRRAERQEQSNTTYILSFTGKNAGEINITSNNLISLEDGGTKYKLNTKTVGNIKVNENLATEISCKWLDGDTNVYIQETGAMQLECPETDIDLETESIWTQLLHPNDNTKLEIKKVQGQEAGGSVYANKKTYKVEFKGIGEGTGNLIISGIYGGYNFTEAQSETITIKSIDIPTDPIQCEIIADPDTVDIQNTGNIIVKCQTNKLDDQLSSEGLDYEEEYIDVEGQANGTFSDGIYTYIFTYTGTQPIQNSRLKLRAGVLHNGEQTNSEASYTTGITVNNPIPDCNTGWDNDYFITPEFWALNPTPRQIACALYGSGDEDPTAYTTGRDSYIHGTSCNNYKDMTVIITGEISNLTPIAPNTIYVLTSTGFEIDSTIVLPGCSAIISRQTNGKDTTINFRNYYGILINGKYSILDNISIRGNDNQKGITINSGSNTINTLKVYGRNLGIELKHNNNIVNNIQLFGNNKGIEVSSTKSTISNAQIYRNDKGLVMDSLATDNIVYNVEIYQNSTGTYVEGNGNTFEDIELYYNDTNIYVLSGQRNNGNGNLQQYPATNFVEATGLTNDEKTLWKSEISGFNRIYSEADYETKYRFLCEYGYTEWYTYTGNNPTNFTGEAATRCDEEGKGEFLTGNSNNNIVNTGWTNYRIIDEISMLTGDEPKYIGPKHRTNNMTNPKDDERYLNNWFSNDKGKGNTDKIIDYSYGYEINTQKNVKLWNNNEGGLVTGNYFVGSNVTKYGIEGEYEKHTKVHYTLTGTSNGIEIKKYDIITQLNPNIGTTITGYIGASRTKFIGTNITNQLTGITINSGVDLYVKTGDLTPYTAIVQMYGEGIGGTEQHEREGYFAEHRYVGELSRRVPVLDVKPENMCVHDEIITMTGTWTGYEYDMTGFDINDITTGDNATIIPDSFNKEGIGLYTWQVSLSGKTGKVIVESDTAEDILEFTNQQRFEKTYYRDTEAPEIGDNDFTANECKKRIINIDAQDYCAGISGYKLEWNLGTTPWQTGSIFRIEANTIGRTGGTTKTRTIHTIDNFGQESTKTITGTIVDIPPTIENGQTQTDPYIYNETINTGITISQSEIIAMLGAKEGECGTDDLSILSVSCDENAQGTLENGSINIHPLNNTDIVCSVVIKDNEDSTKTGYIKFTASGITNTTHTCQWSIPDPQTIKIDQEGTIGLTCNGVDFNTLTQAKRYDIISAISLSDANKLNYTIDENTIIITYTGAEAGTTNFIFSGIELDGTTTLGRANSNPIKVYNNIYRGCTRGEPTYNPIAVGVEAYIDLICEDFEYQAENANELWSVILYSGNTNAIETGTAQWLSDSGEGSGVRFIYTGENVGKIQLKASGDSLGYLYVTDEYSNVIHVIDYENNRPKCTITGTEMVTVGQTGTITVDCTNSYGILTTGITNDKLEYSGNIIVGDSIEEQPGTGEHKTFKFTFTGYIEGTGKIGLRTGAIKTVPGIENRYTEGNIITVVSGSNGIHICGWKDPNPDILTTGEAGYMVLNCILDERIPGFLIKSGDTNSLSQTLTLDNESGPRVLHYTGDNEGTTQYAISGNIGNVHIQTRRDDMGEENIRSKEIRVTNNGIILYLNPQNKISNQDITVNMSGENAEWVKYYKTGTAGLEFDVCESRGTGLDEIGGQFNGTETISNDEDGITYIYLCGALGSDRSGMIVGTYTIDTTKPECTLGKDPTEWTNSGVTLFVSSITETNPKLYSWTGFEDMIDTTGTKIVYTTGDYNFYIKDAAGNTGICSTGVTNIDTQGPTGTVTYINGNGEYGNSCTTGSVTIKLNTGENISGYPEKAFARNSTGNSAWTGNNTKTVTENESGTGYIRDVAGNITAIPYNITGISHSGPSISLSRPDSGAILTGYVQFNWDATITDPVCQAISGGYNIVVYSGTVEQYTGNTNNTNIDTTLPNGNYTWKVSITDILGHTIESEIRPFSINDQAPTCQVEYRPGSGTVTSGDVIATLTGCTPGTTGFNETGHTFTGNGTFVFTFENESGVSGNTTAIVDRIDKVPPVLHEVTPIGTTTDTTPNYTFSSTEPGRIEYSGACSSATTGAISGNNTITLNQLAYGTYSGCTITVTDAAGNKSDVLTISTFTIRQSGGGGGHGLKKDYCPDGDYSDSYYDRTCEGPIDICGVSTSKFNTEMKTAYLYAYQHGMTTICPIDDADLYGFIRRDQLAKILTQYAINVLDLEPQAGKSGCTAYNDIANSSAEMKYYMKTACELDIMGLESDGKTPMKSFYPHGLVSRAEFGTTLSRLIYGDAYNLESEAENTYPGAWYGKHLEALKRDEIMTQIYGDRPQHLELRGYVMLMLMRHGKARLDNVKNIPYSTPEEIMDIYNKNKALTCETSYYESEDDYGSGMLYVKDNKLRENLKIHNEGNISSLIKNNKLYVRGDAIGSGMGMVADAEATALEELEALLDDDAYSFKNCNEAVKNINAFEVPSNIRFKSIGDWFTELANSFTSIFE